VRRSSGDHATVSHVAVCGHSHATEVRIDSVLWKEPTSPSLSMAITPAFEYVYRRNDRLLRGVFVCARLCGFVQDLLSFIWVFAVRSGTAVE